MPVRTKTFISLMILTAGFATAWASKFPSHSWVRFAVYLAAVLLSSGLKVALPRGDGSMSLNFPFILLAVMQLSPLQAILLAALSVAAQCRIRVTKLFTFVQIAFNLANAVVATSCALLMYTALIRFHLAAAPALSLASVAYFLCSTTSVAVVLAWSKREKAFPLWRVEFPWYLPFYVIGAVLAAVADFISLRFGWATSLLLVPMVYTVYRSYTAQMARIREREQHLAETESLHLRTIEGLAMAIEAKDQNTHDHLFRVRDYVAELGAAMHLTKIEIKALQTAAFLHDIGKLAVPEHIINKPGKLTLEEFERMKIHPVVGADILERVRFPYPVVPIVRSHHEWWNGMGYPDGLKGEEIPIGARILTVVDCFDALASDRPYRKALPLVEAMAHIKGLAGTQFDPAVVEVLECKYLQMEARAKHVDTEAFGALNREIDVSRGLAPGAGFERDSNGIKGATSLQETDNRATEAPAGSVAFLDLIAAASHEAQALYEMSQSLGNSLSLKETISVLASRLRSLIPFDSCALYLRVADTLVTQYMDGENRRSLPGETIALGQGVSGWVAQNRKFILNGNPGSEGSSRNKLGETTEYKAALSIPLFDMQSEVISVLTLYAFEAGTFSRDHLRILQAMESKLSLSLQNSLRFRRAENDAETDFLTKLPNGRRLFLQLEMELDRCRRDRSTLAVIVCDLNSFNEVNNRRGHLAGDLLLSSIADGFRQNCRPYDTVARLGGDEFVFLIPGMDEGASSERIQSFAETVTAVGLRTELETTISASLGASFYPSDGETAEELLSVADRRMYRDKQDHYERGKQTLLKDPGWTVAP